MRLPPFLHLFRIMLGCTLMTPLPVLPEAVNREPALPERDGNAGAREFVAEVTAYMDSACSVDPDRAEYEGWEYGEGDLWRLPKEWCRQNLPPVDGEMEQCRISVQAGGKAAVVYIVSDCYELCNVDSWLVLGPQGPQRVAPELVSPEHLPTMVITSDLAYGYTGWAEYCGPQGYCTSMTRVDLRSMTKKTWSECGMPSLSPCELWVVCRALNGDVLRMPVPEGPLEKVYSLDLPEGDQIYAAPEPGVLLHPVVFENDSTMLVRTGTVTLECLHEVRVRWRE